MIKSLKNYLLKKPKSYNYLELIAPASANEVVSYYERETPVYLNTYGSIIQAARPTSDEEFLNYFIKSMNMQNGMRMLDGGCGVCGPASYFAGQLDVHIDGISISPSHIAIAKETVAESKLKGNISLTEGDFSNLTTIYSENQYDLVYFLEVLGYANSLLPVLRGASAVLKPGGSMYIKDFFPVPLVKEEQCDVQLQLLKEIRDEYCYRVLDLINLLTLSRKLGFFLEYARRLDFAEDFTKASKFEIESPRHKCYTKAINNPFQLFEPLELKFQKIG